MTVCRAWVLTVPASCACLPAFTSISSTENKQKTCIFFEATICPPVYWCWVNKRGLLRCLVKYPLLARRPGMLQLCSPATIDCLHSPGLINPCPPFPDVLLDADHQW